MAHANPATPGAAPLLDYLLATFSIKNDAALARSLAFAAPVISKLRNGRMPLGPAHIVKIAETFDLGVKEIKRLSGSAAAQSAKEVAP